MGKIVTPQLISSLFTGYKSLFQAGLGMAAPKYTSVATVINSSTASNTYGWMGQWPEFREWVGDRVLLAMKSHGYQIVNKKYESTISVMRDEIEDDNLGVYAPRFQEMGRATAVFPDQMVFQMLRAGETANCYDGTPFFGANHPVNAKVDGSGTDKKVANLLVDKNYKGDTWYLMDTSRVLKPLIYQQRKNPQFVSMTAAQDEAVFMRDEYRYGVDLRCNVGFAFWQMAYAVKAELNAENVWKAHEAMRAFTADGGRPLGIAPNLMVVPPSLERAATQLLEREQIADVVHPGDPNATPPVPPTVMTTSNELRGKFELLVPDFL